MVETLDTVELKDGEQMRVVRVLAPDHEWRDRIVPLLSHKGQPWRWQMEVTLDEGLPGLSQFFYLGVLKTGDVVGNIMTVESMEPPIGILGHVFTPPEHRRRGICSRLMEAVTEDFRARDGRAMFLHTGYDSPPYHIYASWGFEGYRETGAMRWVLQDDFWRRQFEPRPVGVRQTQWGDWPALEALAQVPEGWHVRSAYLNLHGFGGFEGQYLQVRKSMQEGRLRDFRVLAAEDGAVMGYALVATLRGLPGAPLVLDLFVHPDFVAHAPDLAAAVELPDDARVVAFAEEGAGGKREALESVGLAREATLREMVIDDDGNEHDLLIFTRAGGDE